MISVSRRPAAGPPTAPVGVGDASGDMGGWRTMPLDRLALLSPQIALALARGDQLVPYVASCKATFPDSNTSNIPNVALEGGNAGGGNISFPSGIYQASVIDHVDYQINQQNAFSGQTLKSMADFFFNLQSGISATLDVYGAPQYSVAPFYQPLRSLAAFLRKGFPYGWFLNYNQGLRMSFNVDIPLPSLPVTVAFTYCMWTPSGDRYVRMEDARALEQLAQCGVQVPCPC
jgi:hypothetical protein